MQQPSTHILIIKHGALGDIILATPAFAAIRAQHPSAHITLLTTAPYAALLAKSPYFDAIWSDAKPRWYQLRALADLRHSLNAQRWAWVYDLQASSRTTRYPWLLQRPWPQISNASRWASHPRPAPDPQKHALANMQAQLAVAGVAMGELPDVTWLTEGASNLFHQARVPYALLVPGGAAHRPEKRWPAAQYAQLATALVGQGITPLLIGTAAEAEALATIANAVPQAVNYGGKTSLPQLADLARGAALAVGNDTGPMHLIAAANCPSLVLFSHASDPVRSRPLGAQVQVLRAADLQDLPLEKVLDAVALLPRIERAHEIKRSQEKPPP